jgi:hypothetical protein
MKLNQIVAMNMMHSIRWIGTSLALPAIILTAGCSSTSKSSSASALATVTKLSGAARVSHDSTTWEPLRVGAPLNPGATVQTSTSATLEVDAGERRVGGDSGKSTDPSAPPQHNRISCAPDSLVVFDSLPPFGAYTGDSDIRLTLRSGGVTCSSSPTAESPLCEIKFPFGTVRARGAKVAVQANGVVRVYEGSASWARPNGSGRAIAEGNEYNAKTGQLTKLSGASKGEATAPPPTSAPAPVRLEGPPPRK